MPRHNVMVRMDDNLYARLRDYALTNPSASAAQGRRSEVSIGAAARDAIQRHLDFVDFVRERNGQPS